MLVQNKISRVKLNIWTLTFCRVFCKSTCEQQQDIEEKAGKTHGDKRYDGSVWGQRIIESSGYKLVLRANRDFVILAAWDKAWNIHMTGQRSHHIIHMPSLSLKGIIQVCKWVSNLSAFSDMSSRIIICVLVCENTDELSMKTELYKLSLSGTNYRDSSRTRGQGCHL